MADDLDNYLDSLPQETVRELAKLNLRMSRHKDTRRDHLRNVKKIDPNYQLPGDQQVADLRAELDERREKDEREAAAKVITDRLEAQRRGLIEGTLIPGRKFSPEDVKEIEDKVMPKYGISDYEGAAKIYLGDFKAPNKLPTPHGATWTFPDIPGLMDDPARAARDAAAKVIDELHGRAA